MDGEISTFDRALLAELAYANLTSAMNSDEDAFINACLEADISEGSIGVKPYILQS